MFELTPFAGTRGLSRYFENLENMEKTFLNSFNNFNSNAFSCSTDIVERDNEYVLRAELPGFEKEDIDVSVDNGYLTISASHSSENDQKDGNENYIRRERSYGSYSRRFDVSGIKADDITASYKNGVLELVLPKEVKEESSAKKIDIL